MTTQVSVRSGRGQPGPEPEPETATKPSPAAKKPEPELSPEGQQEVVEPEYRWQHTAGDTVDGKYQLVQPLGRGGMAEVWLALHVHLKLEVAVKFLSTTLTTDEERTTTVLTRFQFEAQISARLGARTRRIVAVHDAGVHDGTPYLVMEYVPGRTLFAEIGVHGPMDPDRFAEVLDDITDALTVAHELGIVHRDLKPSNVMLVDKPDGRVTAMVADFGIAKSVRTDLDLDRPKDTSAEILLGSPTYMSPEQLRTPGSLSARSDIWAIGVLAYEALTDELPFVGNTVGEILVSVSTKGFLPPSKHRRTLPRTIDAWFELALAKDPAQRFGSVAEMARSYRAALSKKPAPPASRPRRLGLPVLATILASLVTVALFGVLAWRVLDPPESRRASRGLTRLVLVSRPPIVRPIASPAPPDAALPEEALSAEASVVAPVEAGKLRRPGTTPERPNAKPGNPSATPVTPATPAPEAAPSPARLPRKEIDKSEVL